MNKRGKNKPINRRYIIMVAALAIVIIVLAILLIQQKNSADKARKESENGLNLSSALDDNRPELDVQLLTPNPYSRPQTAPDKITGIVVHYTANPGTSAMANRNYFEGLKDSHTTYASSHFIVGLDGEIIQCIPTGEIAYASNERNSDTISIEVCHPDETGKFNDASYDSLVWLVGWLCEYLDVSPENVIRHYDVTGKSCPLYYVDHEDAWLEFKANVQTWVDEHPVK